MALQATSVCSLSVIPQDMWLPWSSGIAFRCLCTCVVQHFPLIMSDPSASTSDVVSVPGGRGHAPPHQRQHIQCTVTWFLSESPAADEAAIVGQLQQKSWIHPHNFLLLDSAHTVLFRGICSKGMCNQLLPGWTHIMDPYWSHIWPNQIQK